MAEIPLPPNDTVSLIYREKERLAKLEPPREHLGASVIGRKCAREIWYMFHWVVERGFDGRMERLFEAGHAAEERIANDMRSIGILVHTVDERFITPENPKPQFRIGMFNGWFGGSMDGCAFFIPEAPKTWHVVEFKTHNAKSFALLRKLGVEKAKYEHYCQMQIYMGMTGMTRAFYTAENKDTSELYKERVRFNPTVYKALVDKAYNLLWGLGIPGRISSDPQSEDCRYCDFQLVCHYKREPLRNCRTCAWQELGRDGNFYCTLDGQHEAKTRDEQVKGCPGYSIMAELINE